MLGEIVPFSSQSPAAEHQTQLTQLQNSYQAVQRSNDSLPQEVLASQTDISQIQDDHDQQQEYGREEPQVSQVSTVADIVRPRIT